MTQTSAKLSPVERAEMRVRAKSVTELFNHRLAYDLCRVDLPRCLDALDVADADAARLNSEVVMVNAENVRLAGSARQRIAFLEKRCEEFQRAELSLIERAETAERRVGELEAGLRTAIQFVEPDVQDLVKEFSDFDGTAMVRGRVNHIRKTRDELASLLAAGGAKETP